ncbi:MAG: hypothetical protein QM642_10955 [Edaphocola sp.]
MGEQDEFYKQGRHPTIAAGIRCLLPPLHQGLHIQKMLQEIQTGQALRQMSQKGKIARNFLRHIQPFRDSDATVFPTLPNPPDRFLLKYLAQSNNVLYFCRNRQDKNFKTMEANFGEYVRKLRTENGLTLTPKYTTKISNN